MMKQVRLCAVWPMEDWFGSLLNQIQGWTTVRESHSRALEQGPLVNSETFNYPSTKLMTPSGHENFFGQRDF